jgi:hypothetical protein
MAAAYSIEQWARFALTGDPASATPSDPQLAMVKSSVRRQLIEQYPCIGSDPDNNLTGDDLEAWTEWAGYEVAARYVVTPAGRIFAKASGGTVREKSGRVEISRAEPKSQDAQADYLTMASSARSRITCIASAIRASNGGGMTALPGRRRATGQPATVAGMALAGTRLEGTE